MMESPQIALYIEGTANTKAGLTPLVLIGRFPVGGRLEDGQELVREPLSYAVCHTPRGKCFALVDRKVRPYGSQRKGRLGIYIALPVGMQFANGQSPYTLLKEVYNTFLALYMYEAPSGEHIFNEGSVNKEVFQALLNKYRLERTEMEYVPMDTNGPTAVVGLSVSNMVAELMRDSDYPEFRKYNRVEIGSQVASTINIEIPRRNQFRVVLNQRSLSVVLSSPQDSFDSSRYLSDTEFQTYKDSHVRFTLGELMAARDGSLFGGRVSLHGKVIQCEVLPKDKEVKFSTEIVGENTPLSNGDVKNVEKMLEAGIVKVFLSGKEISKAFLSGAGISLRGRALTAVPTLTADTDYSFAVKKMYGKLTLLVKKSVKKSDTILKKETTPPPPPAPAPWFSKKVMALLCGCSLVFFLLGLLVGRLSAGDIQEENKTEGSVQEEQQMVVETKKEDLVKPVQSSKEDDTKAEELKKGFKLERAEEQKIDQKDNYKTQIVIAVNNRNWGEVHSLLRQAVIARAISAKERQAIEALYWGAHGKAYTAAQRKKIGSMLHGKSFRSINEIVVFTREVDRDL